MGKGRAATLALLLLTVPATLAPAGSQDDAGSGGDAPDRYVDAYDLGGPGTYEGVLSPNGDADWLALNAAHDQLQGDSGCLEASVSGHEALADLDVSLQGNRNHSTVAQLNPDHEPGIGLVAHDMDEAVMGLRPLEENQSTGNWNLSVDMRGLDERFGDGGTGGDAPALEDDADPVDVARPCVGGALEAGDTADAYAMEANTDQEITITAFHTADEEVNVTLHDPEGLLETTISTSGGVATGTADVYANGTWELEITGGSDLEASYFVGVTLAYDEDDDEDDECEDDDEDCDDRKCRPYCMVLE